MDRSAFSRPLAILSILVLVGGAFTLTASLQTVNVENIEADDLNLSLDEEAYYEFVAPRLDRLVVEVGSTREMVETKSRDIVALTRAGSTINTLIEGIRTYGEEHGVPPRFGEVHGRILSASDTVTHTFDEARTALRTFNFSGMSELVVGFTAASDEFITCQSDLAALVA
jgi:hypothetical protein